MKKSSGAMAAGILALATAAAPARAADLSVAPAYKAPVAAPVYNWTGIYLGVNGGYGWGSQDPFGLFTSRFDSFTVPFSGGLLGGTVGAQIQASHVVLGIEADLDWANIKGSSNPTVTDTFSGLSHLVNLTTNINSMSTGRLRVGYAADNILFYATGGLALLGAHTSVSSVDGGACSLSIFSTWCSGPTDFRLGASAGVGLEYGLTQSLSAKVEYLYVAAASLELSHLNVVRAGLNWRFGGL
jgi:outer membrane immunogenic protein